MMSTTGNLDANHRKVRAKNKDQFLGKKLAHNKAGLTVSPTILWARFVVRKWAVNYFCYM